MSEKLVLFDLDGTLIDTAPDICSAVNNGLKAANIAPISELTARAYIGEGSAKLMHRATTKEMDGVAPENYFSKVYKDFCRHYSENLFVDSVIYSGALESLDELKSAGFKLGCITNKPYEYALPLLEKAGLAHLFDILLGGNSLKEKKPNPKLIKKRKNHFRIKKCFSQFKILINYKTFPIFKPQFNTYMVKILFTKFIHYINNFFIFYFRLSGARSPIELIKDISFLFNFDPFFGN